MQLKKIKTPFENDEHAFESDCVIPSLTNPKKIVQVLKDSWKDKFQIRYKFTKGKLFIGNYQNYIKKHGMKTLARHLNAIPFDIEVVFDTNSMEEINVLAENLNQYPLNKKTIVYAAYTTEYDKSQKINLSLLPDNAKFTIYDYKYDLENATPGWDSRFDYWMLWQNEDDFVEYLSKLDKKTRERETDLRKAVLEFYKTNQKALSKMTSIEKADLVYEWCKKNTVYDFGAIKRDGNIKDDCRYSQDAWETLKRKKGVCSGRAGLMKALLNNRFLGVDCFCLSGIKTNLPHEWNVVYDENKIPHYYDLSFGLKRFIGNLENKGYSRLRFVDTPIFSEYPKPIFKESGEKPKRRPIPTPPKPVKPLPKPNPKPVKPLPKPNPTPVKPLPKPNPTPVKPLPKPNPTPVKPLPKPENISTQPKSVIKPDGTYRLKREDIPNHLRITYINPRKDPYLNYNLNSKPKEKKSREDKVLKKQLSYR